MFTGMLIFPHLLAPNSKMVGTITTKANTNHPFVVLKTAIKFMRINWLIFKLSHEKQVSSDDTDSAIPIYDRNLKKNNR